MKAVVIILLVLVGVYLYLVAPNMKKRDLSKYMNHHYAHRGLHDNNGEAPENSMAAFKLAVENGYGIELDVQLSKDDVPVVFHDSTLNRVCGVEGNVCDYTFEELQQFKLCKSEERIPKFTDFLALIDGKVPFILEYKSEDSNMQHLCEVISKELESYKGDYVIESFNPLVVAWYKKNHPEIIRGQLSMRFMKDGDKEFAWKFFAIQHLLTNVLARPDFIAYDHRAYNAFGFKVCKLLGALPVTWTIVSQERMDEMRKHFKLFIFEQFKAK